MPESKQNEERDAAAEDRPDDGHHYGRVAVIAAASGATAYAARKVLAGRSTGSENGSNGKAKRKSGVDASSLVEAAVSSGWDVARDSLIPVIEDAAARAGSFLGERAPDLVRDVVVPRFITGFEKASGRPPGGDE